MAYAPSIGSISHGTLRSVDLLETFADELNRCSADHALVIEARTMLDAWDDNEPEEASELIGELQDALQEYAPPYCYFGAHEGDGSDFGFWPDMYAIDDLPKFNDCTPDELPDDDFVVVNDHGNVTLYNRDGQEIWAIV